jgi:hypothetical protein
LWGDKVKIPEKAPDYHTTQLPLTPDFASKLSEVIKKANSEYTYWDDFK